MVYLYSGQLFFFCLGSTPSTKGKSLLFYTVAVRITEESGGVKFFSVIQELYKDGNGRDLFSDEKWEHQYLLRWKPWPIYFLLACMLRVGEKEHRGTGAILEHVNQAHEIDHFGSVYIWKYWVKSTCSCRSKETDSVSMINFRQGEYGKTAAIKALLL